MSFKQKSSSSKASFLPFGKKERDLSHHNSHYCSSFDVIKVNNYGKRQQRTIAVSSQGVSNLNGQTCQWFVKSSDVYSIERDVADATKFTLTFLHKYHFEAESTEQATLIVNEFRRMNVGFKDNIINNGNAAAKFANIEVGSLNSSASTPSSPLVSPNLSPQQPSVILTNSNAMSNVPQNSFPSSLSSSTSSTASSSSGASSASKLKNKGKGMTIDQQQNRVDTVGLSPFTPSQFPLNQSSPVPNTPNAFSPDGARVWKIRAEELKRQFIKKSKDEKKKDRVSGGKDKDKEKDKDKLSSSPSSPPKANSTTNNSSSTHTINVSLNNLNTSNNNNNNVKLNNSNNGQLNISLNTSNSSNNSNSNNNNIADFEYSSEANNNNSSKSTKKSSQKNKKKLSIEDFDLIKVLGVGSFGRVFLVRKKDTQRLYAMKVLNKRDMMKKKQIAHTNTEKMVLSTMDHPFIVSLHFAFQNEEYLFMCMDYIPGGELFQHLQKAGRFPEELAKFYIAEVITSLEYLHGNNIIYRDIKPENILLDEEGHIKLTDFGLSKSGITSVVGKHGEGQFATTFCGTPEYLAPEIITGAGHGKAADWWSVGILLFEMLTGRSPFLASNRNDMYKAMIQGNLRLPMFLSSEAQDLLEKLLVPDPKKRLGSGGVAEIQNHAFFELIPWRMLESKMITPPFKPSIKPINLNASKEDPDLNPAITFQKRRSSATMYDSPFKNFSWNKDDSILASTTASTNSAAIGGSGLDDNSGRNSMSSSTSSPSSPANPSPLHERKGTLKSIRKSSV